MNYNKKLIDKNGEEFPYSETFDEESYFYRISVIWNNRDSVLSILKAGSHLEFDDDGSWLDFNIAPEKIFPGKERLSDEDLLHFIEILEVEDLNKKTYTRKEIDSLYQTYLNSKK